MTAPTISATYADAEGLAAWFAGARAGQRCVYARGCGLRPDHATVRLVAGWAARGDAVTSQRKCGEADFQYFVAKCAARAEVLAGVPERRDATVQALVGTPAGELLDYVRGLIADGLPLPTYAAIAAELGQDNPFWRHRKGGAPDLERVRYQMKKLQLCGLIRIETGKAEERIVVCLISGGRTAAVEAPRHHERIRA